MKRFQEHIANCLYLTCVATLILTGCASQQTEGLKVVTEFYEPTSRSERGIILMGEAQQLSGTNAHSLGLGGNQMLISQPDNMVFLNPAAMVNNNSIEGSGGLIIKKITADVDIIGADTSEASYGITTFNLPVSFGAGFTGKVKENLALGISVHSARDFNFVHDIVYYEVLERGEVYRYNYTSSGELRGISAGFGYAVDSSWAVGLYGTLLYGEATSSYYDEDSTTTTDYEQVTGTAQLDGIGLGGSFQYTLPPDTASEFIYTAAIKFSPGDWINATCRSPYFDPTGEGQFDLHYPAELICALLMEGSALRISFQAGATFPVDRYIAGFENSELSHQLATKLLLGIGFEAQRGKVVGRMGLSYYDSNFLLGFGSSSLLPSLGSFDLGFGIGGGSGEFLVVFGFGCQFGKSDSDSFY